MRFYLRDWHRKDRRRQHLPEGEHCWNPRAKLRNNAGNNRATAEKEAGAKRPAIAESKDVGAPVRATGAAPKEEREVKLLPDSVQITEMRWSIREGKLVHIVRHDAYKTFAYRPLFPSKNPLRDLIFSYVNSPRNRVYVRQGEAAYIPWKEWVSKRRGSSRAQYVCKPA